MPFSYQTYGFSALLILAGIVIINEVLKYFRHRQHNHHP
jgi:hypothetical protein